MTRRSLFASTLSAWGHLALCSFLFCCMPMFMPAIARAQSADDVQRQLKDALGLYEQGRYIEALPLFQHLDEIHPNDAVVKAHLGFTLVALAVTKSDPEEREQVRIRARKYLLDAQGLGDKSSLVAALLDGLPPDGIVAPYSSRKEVDDAMREGETAFANGDLEAATAAYQRALLLDPNQYFAALFIGDVHFRKKEMEQAGVWFARAIAIDPNTETAYRYWGDALAQSGNYSDALEKYIDAIVAQPYLRTSNGGLLQFALLRHKTLTQPHIVSPNSHNNDGNKTNITIDGNTLSKKDGTEDWLIYEMSRSTWNKEKFKTEYPDEEEYRHSLKEETGALSLMAGRLEEQMKSKEIDSIDPTLAILLKLENEGLIEAYVLISAPDQGIAKDYPAYRDAHRGLIHQYIEEYVAAPLAKKD